MGTNTIQLNEATDPLSIQFNRMFDEDQMEDPIRRNQERYNREKHKRNQQKKHRTQEHHGKIVKQQKVQKKKEGLKLDIKINVNLNDIEYLDKEVIIKDFDIIVSSMGEFLKKLYEKCAILKQRSRFWRLLYDGHMVTTTRLTVKFMEHLGGSDDMELRKEIMEMVENEGYLLLDIVQEQMGGHGAH